MNTEQLWVVIRLDEQDQIVDVFEYDTMEEARDSFDEEVQVEGHRAALLPKWLYDDALQDSPDYKWDEERFAAPIIRTWLTDDSDQVVAEIEATPANYYSPALDFGPCCVCQAQEATGFTQLPFTAPVPGTGWGCVQCQQPMNGAMAVLCDDCGQKIEAGVLTSSDIKEVCLGLVGEGARIAVADYAPVEFGHNLSRHPEVGSVN